MNMSGLNANERMAVYGAGASILGAILTLFGYGFGGGGLWLTFILALAMLFVIFQPQWAPNTSLPGSKGSLMVIIGGVAGLGSLIGLFGLLSFLGLLAGFAGFFILPLLGLLIGIIGGAMMGWAGWKEFQSEGGTLKLGATTTGGSTMSPPAAPPAAPPVAPPAASPADRGGEDDPGA
jgi:hypothetical protein